MTRVWNFSAGPAALPEAVLAQAAQEMLDWRGQGLSVMEMSHRSPAYASIFENAQACFRRLLNVPDSHDVLFMQGGAVAMNAIIPLNLLKHSSKAAFINTGTWSEKTTREFARYGQAQVVLSNAQAQGSQAAGTYVPDCTGLLEQLAGQSYAYLHYCDNETIGGVEFHGQLEALSQQLDCPLVADMSSNMLSRAIDVNRFDVIYGGAQKNIGPAGLTLVIIRKTLLDRALSICPSAFEFATVAKNGSMYNTPPTYAIYIAGLVFEWLEKQGGVAWAQAEAKRKSECLYQMIDASSLYRSPVQVVDRSRMNVPFVLADDALNERFLQQAAQHNLVQLKGHKSVGGMRASLYNAMPFEGVQALTEFMRIFEKECA